ncbi:unnamed protein product [Adineta steineri]|uniref:BED-type domain-containing protein n=1 Tax=Adineta steineri TaxID=433720 RepID=A0A818Z7R5_9BILA|nr:unnamed protein product [Adineta steineri]CAF3764624.1 unnamed protein product [Adineta steineri]
MSARSRVNAQTSDASNSSTPSTRRVRSTTVRNRSSSYGSLGRRSTTDNDENQLSSESLERPKNNKPLARNQPRNSKSRLSTDEIQQIFIQNQMDDNDESPQTTSNSTVQIINSQSSSTHTTTNNLLQNLSLNDSSTTTLTILPNNVIDKKHIIDNEKVYNLFNKIDTNLFSCKTCQEEIKGGKYSTTNLRKHIGLTHKQPEYLYPSQRKSYFNKSNSITSERKKKLHLAVISCIIIDSRSFNDFNKKGMRTFLDEAVPGYVPPHRATVKAALSKRYQHHRHLLKIVLEKVQEIALTTDVWKNSRGTHFICLTAHFFDSKYRNISLTIGFRQLVGDHIAERLGNYILYELESLKITKKICSITTDNAANVICATNVSCFGIRYSCMAHNLNLVVQDGLHLHDTQYLKVSSGASNTTTTTTTTTPNYNSSSVDTATGDEDEIECSSSDEEQENLNGDNDDGDDWSDDDDLNNGGNLKGDEDLNESFEHDVQIQVDKNVETTDDTLLNICRLVERIRRFIRLVRRTYFINDYFKQEAQLKQLTGDGLVLDCKVRWNSSYYMIERFLNYDDVINQVILDPRVITPKITLPMINRLKNFFLNEQEWATLIDIRNLLSQFEHACRLMSRRKYQTLSLGYLILVGLANHLSKPLIIGPETEIQRFLRESLYNTFCYHINDKIACFLDPETIFLMTPNDKEKAHEFITNEARYRKLSSQTNSSASISSNTNNRTLLNKNSYQLNDFLARCGLPSHTTNSTRIDTNKSITEELSHYMNKIDSSTTFEDFWVANEKELPCLSVLVRSFNIRPVTSIPSESLFSIAAYVNRKQRCSLSPRTLMYSMLLRDADILQGLL